ncbi:hypothetical protein Thiofri_00648 [Thiorhodovibrio frisius]|nr:hypothetical protein Thiofri_00648 [Thiorhodovibrio frisius]
MAMKEQALARLQDPTAVVPSRFQPTDALRQFLENL